MTDHDHDGDAPRHHDRQQEPRLREAQRADLPRAAGDQLAVVGQVAGEEDGQRQLGELTWLEVDRAEADPDPGAAERAAEPRHERQQQQADAGEQEDPAVAGQVGGPLHDDQRQHEGADGQHAPGRLQAGQVFVQPSDHDVADAVKDGGQRQQGPVSALGEPPHTEVGDEQQPEEDGEERDDPRRDDGELAERGERVGAGRDERGHHDQRQLRRATGAGDRRRDGHQRVDGRAITAPSARPWWSSWSWSSWSSWSSSWSWSSRVAR